MGSFYFYPKLLPLLYILNALVFFLSTVSMSLCNNILWLQIAGSNDLTISDISYFQYLVGELLKPYLQTLSIVFFYSKKGGNKDIVLRFLFPYNNTQKNRFRGIANIRINNATIYTEYPIFFIDRNVKVILPLKQTLSTCYKITTYLLIWPYTNA